MTGTRRERVVVAMSGGVDSSVAAALLSEGGHEVSGLTLRVSGEIADAEEPARLAARALGVPLEVVGCEERFDREVLRPAWEDYRSGRTPNPCVVCNPTIKLRLLLERADALGASKVATGHYARIERREGGTHRLLRGVDRGKDQSYFLHALDESQRARTLFPVGALTKEAVRRIAAERGLPSADRRESQDACIASATLGLASVLERRFGRAPLRGDFVDEEGIVVGRHSGVHRYTIGQRKGLGLSLGKPAFVIGIDATRGIVRVSTRPELLLARGLWATSVVWHGAVEAGRSFRTEVQVRYRTPPSPATVTPVGDGEAEVIFDEPLRAVAPGQAAVLYQGDEILGGGRIHRALLQDDDR